MGNVRSKPGTIEQWRRHGSRTRASLPSQALHSGPALVSGTPQPAEELEMCSDDIEPSPPGYSRRVLMRGGLGLTEPPEVTQWRSFEEIYLMENQLTELPQDPPPCPVLLVLFLNRNYKLRTISPSFFDYMPALEILNLSRTRIKSLPESLFRLSSLKRLFLNHCELLMVLPPKIGELQQLEVLDLEGTEIMDLPKEVAKLTKLTCLEVSFCPRVNRGTKSAKVNALIPQGTISALSQLEELSIDVNPEDERWESVVEAVVDDVCGLLRLDTLKLYFPQVGYLRKFKWFGTSKVSRSLSHFKFIVGDHGERIMSRLPVDLEFELEHWDRSLKYVNGVGVPRDIQKMLRHTTAFFLDRHTDVTKLSDFGIENMEQLRCCIIGECNEIQVIIDGTDMYDEADRSEIVLETWENDERLLGSLEYLYVYHMKSLRGIYEGPMHQGCLSHLKCLALLTCPRLTTIFTPGLLENLNSLEELKVEGCPLILSLVRCEDACIYENTYFVPKLKKISLFSLPELISISNGLRIAPNLEQLSIIDCPNLKSPSPNEICFNHPTGTKEQSIPSDASREQPAPPGVSLTTSGNADPSTSMGRTAFPNVSQKPSNLKAFTLSELKSVTKNFSRSVLIGEGGFGSVYRGTIKITEDPSKKLEVAVKQLGRKGNQGHKEWVTEVSVLGVVEHPNLVKLVGYCAEDDERGIQRLLVYEYMPNGSVYAHLSSRSQTPLPWEMRLKIAQDTARGLTYLHEQMDFQIIFRDFKSSNILLDGQWNAKLSDFGLARLGPQEGFTHVSTAVVGTSGYVSPEYMQTGHLTSKNDVWSYGVFLYELITGRRPLDRNLPKREQKLLEWMQPYLYDSKNFKLIVDRRLEGKYQVKSLYKLATVANKCLLKDPKSRPKMSEVLELVDEIVRESTGMDSLNSFMSVETQGDTETTFSVSWTQSLPSSRREMSSSETETDSECSAR
ncbi:uncharacterized protein LOC115662500 [Syzygium oleosum]|uniref:uncharacterized protein LOC115662500 n=1 Tax=Syzygium oleosum TaxID=219896 RepID=UPI0024BAA8D1|nr:uncharacterized protein LOC115662500 [Syzygium oleosum]